jgi:hypothetical protein
VLKYAAECSVGIESVVGDGPTADSPHPSAPC